MLFIGTLLMAVGFASLHGLNPHSTYPEFAWPTLILATGIGMCTAPTTSAIMGAVPDERQGVASAVNDTSREMGGALGIAVAGSIWPDAIPTNSHPGWRTFPPRSTCPRPIRWPKPSSWLASLGPKGASWPKSARPHS